MSLTDKCKHYLQFKIDLKCRVSVYDAAGSVFLNQYSKA